MSPASYKHGVFAMRLGGRMLLHAEDNDLGFVFAAETGFQLTSKPDTVRELKSCRSEENTSELQ